MSRTNAGPTDVRLHRVTADWGEGTSDAGGAEGMGAPSTSGDATWTHRFFDTEQWSSPGGDFLATASATTQVLTTGTYVWGSTATMVADVGGWIATPGSNFGWILLGDETQLTSAKRFESRSASNPAADRPALTIYYTPP